MRRCAWSGAFDVSIAFDQAVLSSVVLLDHSCSDCEFVPNTIVSFDRWLFTTITSSFILLQELPHQLLMASSHQQNAQVLVRSPSPPSYNPPYESFHLSQRVSSSWRANGLNYYKYEGVFTNANGRILSISYPRFTTLDTELGTESAFPREVAKTSTRNSHTREGERGLRGICRLSGR
ncbi:hypothetical protein R1flu_029132 [Riccia fluitans]|uniref:Uncharacterized protein n=1 Tax=Riccia fluitans TaxID=41844 RepID=A0ABD1XP70_9MARC